MRKHSVKCLLAASIVSFSLAAPLAIAADTIAPPSESAASKQDLTFARSLSRAFRTVGTKVEPSVVHITQLNKVLTLCTDLDDALSKF